MHSVPCRRSSTDAVPRGVCRAGSVYSVPYRGGETFQDLALFAAVHTFNGEAAANYRETDPYKY